MVDDQPCPLQTNHCMIVEVPWYFSSWMAHINIFFLSFACQSLVLEVYILIFQAPCAGWAPDSWLSQKSKIATDKASNFYIFLENTFGGLPGLVGISRTKLKPKDPGIHLSRSQRLVLARKHQTIAKTKENKWGKTRIFYYYWGGCSSTMEVWLIGLRSTMVIEQIGISP